MTETELEQIKALRGGSVEDGTVSVDKPLHEVLRENKEKKVSVSSCSAAHSAIDSTRLSARRLSSRISGG